MEATKMASAILENKNTEEKMKITIDPNQLREFAEQEDLTQIETARSRGEAWVLKMGNGKWINIEPDEVLAEASDDVNELRINYKTLESAILNEYDFDSLPEDGYDAGAIVTITTEHSASSYNKPVILLNDRLTNLTIAQLGIESKGI